MGTPQTATLPINNTALLKLFRAWGWTIVPRRGKGSHQNLKKGDVKVAIRMGSQHSTYHPVTLAATKDGVSVEEWLKGPTKERQEMSKNTLSQDDLTWFVHQERTSLKWDEDKKRYGRIRAILEREGTLVDWLKVQDKNLAERSVIEPVKRPVPKVEPVPVDVSTEGYTTLEAALALRGPKSKLNEISRTSAEILAILSKGDVHSDSGQATALINKQLTKQITGAGLSGLILKLEQVGAVWRKTNGKRTFDIGLTVPIKLSASDYEYLGWENPNDGPVPIPKPDHSRSSIVPVPVKEQEGPSIVEELVEGKFNGAIQALREEWLKLSYEKLNLESCMLSIESAIKLLEEKGG